MSRNRFVQVRSWAQHVQIIRDLEEVSGTSKATVPDWAHGEDDSGDGGVAERRISLWIIQDHYVQRRSEQAVQRPEQPHVTGGKSGQVEVSSVGRQWQRGKSHRSEGQALTF